MQCDLRIHVVDDLLQPAPRLFHRPRTIGVLHSLSFPSAYFSRPRLPSLSPFGIRSEGLEQGIDEFPVCSIPDASPSVPNDKVDAGRQGWRNRVQDTPAKDAPCGGESLPSEN